MQPCHYLDSLPCIKINASSFLAPIKFAVEYRLPVPVVFWPVQHSLGYLFAFIRLTAPTLSECAILLNRVTIEFWLNVVAVIQSNSEM